MKRGAEVLPATGGAWSVRARRARGFARHRGERSTLLARLIELRAKVRRRVDASLRIEQGRLRTVFESLTEAMGIFDAKGELLYFSPPTELLLGGPPGVTAREAASWVVAEDLPQVEREILELLDAPGGTRELELRVRRRDGVILWIECRVTNLLEVGEVRALVVSARDVTARREAERAVRASQERYRRIVETTREGVVTVDAATRITFVNERLAAMLGYRVDELTGTSVWDLLMPEARELGLQQLEKRRSGEATIYQQQMRRKDGQPIWVEVNSTPMNGPDGTFECALGMISDLTERRQAQDARLRAEEQLRQVQKMEAVGSLAGGVAHDFNNVLSVMLSYTAFALEEAPLGSSLRSDLETVAAAGGRAADLTRHLLAFSRQQVLEPRVIELGPVVTGLERMLRRVIGEHIDLQVEIDESTAPVHADASQVEQVIMNLVVNARDAMPGGGRITISLSNATSDAEASGEAAAAAGGHVVLSVRDSGCGMDAETQARVFDPFFTTKGVGKGTGLGLATVHGIVHQSGGHIEITSRPGEGATFHVYFPSTDLPVRLTPLPEAPPDPSRGTETILFVEDDDDVRAALRAVLKRQGYHLLEAQNGGEALLIAESHDGPIHLLMTDVVLPRMSGRHLAERLVLLHPNMRTLYVSGYPRDLLARPSGLADAAFFPKPFTPETLTRKVRDVLDGRPTRPGKPRES